MKQRIGFVSNSSSSSFVISKEFLTKVQLWAIKNHVHVAKEAGIDMQYVGDFDEWKIIETEETISGSTSMNNFDMEEFLEEIGIPRRFVAFDGADLFD